jgi:hypothetical protein
MWAPTFAAGMAVQLCPWEPLVAALTTGRGSRDGGALVTHWLLGRIRFDPSFGRARDMPLFIAVTAVGLTVTPSIGMVGFHLAGVPPIVSDLVRWSRWWSNCVMGAILIAPALIAINRAGLARLAERPLEGTAWVLGVLASCGLIVLTPGPVGRSVVVMCTLSLIVVGAIRFGVTLSSLGAMAILVTTAVSFDFGVGLFGHFAELPGRLTLFVFDATLIASSLVVTALARGARCGGAGEVTRGAALCPSVGRRAGGGTKSHCQRDTRRPGPGIDRVGAVAAGAGDSCRAPRRRGGRDLDDLAKLATHCIEGSQRMVRGLSPISDAGGSLESALQALARRASLSGTQVSFRMRGDAQLMTRTAASDHIYRIAQEAVQNALKHAAAASIAIELWADKAKAGLSVTDDGRGMTNDAVHSGLGMRTMHFRASAIGGTLSIESLRSGGTLVRCEAPLGIGAADAATSEHHSGARSDRRDLTASGRPRRGTRRTGRAEQRRAQYHAHRQGQHPGQYDVAHGFLLNARAVGDHGAGDARGQDVGGADRQPQNVGRLDGGEGHQLGGGALRVGQVRLADLLADRDDDALPADHGAQSQSARETAILTHSGMKLVMD